MKKYFTRLIIAFSLLIANCSISFADTLSTTTGQEGLVRPVRWIWFALAGLVAAFIVSRFMNKRNQRKK